jgi:hypothetical protein
MVVLWFAKPVPGGSGTLARMTVGTAGVANDEGAAWAAACAGGAAGHADADRGAAIVDAVGYGDAYEGSVEG